MTTSEKPTEGWGWPFNSRKAHYYVGGMSLCRPWMMLGGNVEQGNDDSPDNCKTCTTKLKKRNEQVRASENTTT